MEVQTDSCRMFAKVSRPMPFVDVVRSDILDDEKISEFVFGPPQNESILPASLAFP
jgi:hypothetical protein